MAVSVRSFFGLYCRRRYGGFPAFSAAVRLFSMRIFGAAGLFGIIREIPSAALELKTGVTDELFYMSSAKFALFQRIIIELLEGFEYLSALLAPILVYGHCRIPPS
jgi:hypothetical protein